jgi:hypothetical protein
VIETLQPAGTELLSKKKNTVAAKQAIDTSQNEIPTKSSDANNTVSAFATPEAPIRATAVRANNFSFFIKNSLLC